MKKTILLGCVVAIAACGGNNETNNGPNNTTPTNNTDNNTSNNTTPTNNVTTPSNNVTTPTNNMTTPTNNMTGNNPYGLSGECGELDYDETGDGTTDAFQLQEQDAAGGANPTALVTDIGADGTTDWAMRSTWNADGLELTRDQDSDGDGTYDMHIEWTYNADGNLTGITLDQGADQFLIVATYDANGNLLTSTRDGAFDAMGNLTPADGTPDFTDTRTYDGENLLTLNIDADGDGTDDFIIVNMYDADGNVTNSQRDGNYDFEDATLISAADGTQDVIRTWTYDGMGRVNGYSQDGLVGAAAAPSDGTADRFEQNHVYDADDQLISFEIDGRDAVGGYIGVVANGTFDLITLTYDADGNGTGLSADEGNDGSVEYVQVLTFDAAGNVLTLTKDGVLDNENAVVTAADGTIDWTETNTWNADGQQLTANIDVDTDTTAEFTAEQRFDADGNPTYVMWDGEVNGHEVVSAADGTPDGEITWTYDAMGRVTSFNQMANGVQGQISSWTYMQCTDFL